MTREQITSLINPYLSNLIYAEAANLIRAEYILGGSLAGIYYFEYTDDEIDRNVEEFQETHIASDYYNHPGHLQWNHYLIFVRGSGTIPLLTKSRIEADDIYTRKFVMSGEEVEKYFTYKFSNQALDSDIVTIWKKKLAAVDLDEVYAFTPYTEAVPRFVNNSVIKEPVAEQASPGSVQETFQIDILSRIYLRNNYRTHPKPKRTYDFKKVNLLRGANGSGKTSLLNAIELIIAGKTIADPSNGDPEPARCIVGHFNGNMDTPDEFTPDNNPKYRRRDNFWYSTSYTSGNELHRTFNRYNFFDSDAAYKLSSDNDSLHITKYISSIALGPEFGRIQDRMKGFEERLSRELRNQNKLIRELEERRDEAQNLINAIKIESNPQTIFDLFANFARQINWLPAIPSSIEEDTKDFEQSYREILATISSLQESAESMMITNQNQAHEEQNKISQAAQRIKELKHTMETEKGKTIQAFSKVENEEQTIKILQRNKLIFDNPDAFRLPLIEEEINTLSNKVSSIALVPDQYLTISQSEIFKTNQSLEDAKQNAQTLKQESTEKLLRTEHERKALEQTMDELAAVVESIKAQGQYFLTLENDATTCPLCEAVYSGDQLAQRINTLRTSSKDNGALRGMIDLMHGYESSIREAENLLNNLKIIEGIASALLPSMSYNRLSFPDLQSAIIQAVENLRADQKKKEELEDKKNYLAHIGINTSDLQNRKLEFERAFPDIIFAADSKSWFDEKLTDSEKLENLKLVYLDQKVAENAAIRNFNEFLQTLTIPPSETDSEKYLKFNEEKLNKVVELFNKVRTTMATDSTEDLFEIKGKLNRLHILFSDYKKAYSEQAQMHQATQTIATTSEEIRQLASLAERIQSGLTVIQEILTRDSEQAVLGEFLKSNEKDIEEIFLSLHAPKEFHKLEFNYAAKTVLLHKTGSVAPVTLNRISTGQRTALALAIFLALHKKLTRGPKILLFDDPVTYTDDLNILSFLDYLRLLVVKENRQLFFATANKKLAGLFEKKFAFLNENFELIPLQRQD